MLTGFYKVSLGDVSQIVPAAEAMNVAGEMVKNNPGLGVPKLSPCDENGNAAANPAESNKETLPSPSLPKDSLPVVSVPAPSAPPAVTSPVYSEWSNTVVSDSAKERIEAQHKAIEAAGGPRIDTTQQFFATGTRMAKEGYATQHQRAKEHQEKPFLIDAIHQLQEKILSEKREDHRVSSKDIARHIAVIDDKQVTVNGYFLTEQAIRGLVGRLESPSIGYVLGLRERISNQAGLSDAFSNSKGDANMMAEILRYECLRNPDVEFKLRTRKEPHDIYAALSPTYAVADAPMVSRDILKQMPSDAKGDWKYDPETTAWELDANIWTPTPVDDQAVGEAYEGYVSLSSRDNGTGRFNGGGGINLLRCLNASTYSAEGERTSRVHRGKIMLDIRDMIQKSMKAISALCAAWGKARTEEVDIPVGLTLEQAMPGIWRSLLKEGELAAVLPGRKENLIKDLTREYFNERRNPDTFVRADLAQSWTRHIQTYPMETRQEAESAIGRWLVKPPRQIRCDMKE